MAKYIAESRIRGLGGKTYDPGDELPNNAAVRALAKRGGVVREFADHKPKGGSKTDGNLGGEGAGNGEGGGEGGK